MRISNLLAISALSLIAMVSFINIPEAPGGVRAVGSILPVSREIGVKEALPLTASRKVRG